MIKRLLALLSVLFVMGLVVGCAQTSSESGSTATEAASTEMPMDDAMQISMEKAKELGTVAVALEKEPERASEILEEHGMTSESMEAMMVEIAADPALTEAYEAARKAASASH